MSNKLLELKKKGNGLIKDGCALVDTSNRTREVKEKSILVLSSKKIGFSVMITSSEKRKIAGKLEQKYPKNRIFLVIHSVKLYYALKENIEILPAVYICSEGFNIRWLKYYLKLLLKEKYNEHKIHFKTSLKPMFGKKNIAHKLALKIKRKEIRPSLILEEKYFRNLGLL